jgi:DNA-binding CsgD family transcriptional regulator
LVYHDTAAPAGCTTAHVNLDQSTVDAYEQYYATINPWLARPDARPPGVVVTSDTIVPFSDLVETEYYQDFWRPLHIDVSVGVTIRGDMSRSLVLSLMGRRTDLGRDRIMLRRLQLLAPHMLRAAQLAHRMSEVATREAAASAGLDRLATALLLVNSSGTVVYGNIAAGGIIDSADGLTSLRGMLDPANPADGQTLRHLLTQALAPPPNGAAVPRQGTMRITRPSGRPSYEILVAPVCDTPVRLGFSEPLAAVFVRDPTAGCVLPLDLLRGLYALTNAEARLMQALLRGDTTQAVSQRLGISKETLRSQLRVVFLKTGTRSQMELLRLGLRGVAAFHG